MQTINVKLSLLSESGHNLSK